jgi:Tol biopolymer transport system component/DNA-binding winged helix-turn-helix (wHTH) protein
MTATPNGPEEFAGQPEFAGRFVFDEFIVDTVGRTLLQNGTPVPLNSKAFDTLMLLVSNAGATVAKETLLEAVWPGVAVEENNLNQAVSALRKALGDTTSPRRFIITVPNRGYRFVRPVTMRPSVARAAYEPPPRRDREWRQRAWFFQRPFRGGSRAPYRAALAAGAIAGSLMIAWWWGATAIRFSSPGLRGAELTRAVPITTELGDEEWPRFSPDGTRIAFLWRQDAPRSSRIAVKSFGTESVTRITSGPGHDFYPVWSPDGQSIAFQRGLRTPDVITTQLCLVPATGGEARVLHSQPWSVRPGIAWWAAGQALILPVRADAHAPFHLAALDLRTMRPRPLTSPPPAPLLTNPGDAMPALSPDGRLLAFVRETHEGMDVFVTELTAATMNEAALPAARRLTFEHHDVLGLEWHPAGDSVIVSSPRSGVAALYRVMLADGTIARLPNVDDGATQPAVDPRSGRLAFRQEQVDTNIYRVDFRAGAGAGGASVDRVAVDRVGRVDSGSSRARRIIASSRLDDSPHVSPDGTRIAFASSRSGAREIWLTDADGGHPRQLTFLHGRAEKPQWSPDGRSIAFDAFTSGRVRPDIYVIDAGSGSPRALTADASFDSMPTWAADGKSLYFMSDRSAAWEIWNVPIAGGPARRVTEGGALRAQESADGSSLYYGTDAPEVKRRAIGTALAAGDESVARFPADTHWGGDWTITRRGLYFLNAHLPAGRAIEFLPFRFGRPGRPVRVAYPTARASERASFSVAPDESWLVFSQEDYSSRDIMLLPRVP